MSIADIIISMVIFLFQKLVLPVLPVNLPLLSFSSFRNLLNGSLKHNLTWGFAGVGQLFNLELLFILLSSMIIGEILFWLVKAGLYMIKLVRG